MSSHSKQYGLIKPKQASQAPSLKRPSVFDEDSDSMDGTDLSSTDWIKKSYQKEAEKNRQKREVKKQLDKALEDDPSVFQYDELYDEMQTKKTETIKAKKDADRKPRYIQSLLAQAERRKRENEYRNERLIQKERETEGEQFKDKETFVTSAYRKKLEEFKKMDESERRQDLLEEIGDVTKQQDLSGFYRHLYQSTVSEEKTNNKPEREKIKLCKSPVPSLDNVKIETVVKNEVESEPLAPNKCSSKTRHYRKRNKSSSSSDERNEEMEEKKKRKKVPEKFDEKTEDKNLDADINLSSSSSESSSSDSSSSSSDSENESEPEETLKTETDLISGSEEGEIVESSQKKAKEIIKESLDLDDKDSKQETVKKDKSDIERKKKNSELKKDAETVEIKSESVTNAESNSADEEVEEKEEKKINIWEKRTVGDVFDAALKRYLERKASRNRGA